MTSLKESVVAELAEVRERTFALLDPISAEDMTRQISPIMSPLVWDLAHMANYEELWLVHNLGGGPCTSPRYDDMYNAFEHPRRERPSLDLLGPDESFAYYDAVRARTLAVLDGLDLDGSDPLVCDGFVHAMVVMHDHQHVETLLAAMKLGGLPCGRDPWPGSVDGAGGVTRVPGGPATLGTGTHAWAFDNEKPAHTAHVDGFDIDTLPVTNGRYREFISDGGYRRPELWSSEGREWLAEARAGAPLFWSDELDPGAPVMHVCWYEADAFSRWAGRRLPTELEWEKTASGPGGLPGVGEVWEWTSSDFQGYPAFISFPYKEYSEVFFGSEYKVLRGASWATHRTCRRPTFRNWDLPIRRQIFAGFRTAASETP